MDPLIRVLAERAHSPAAQRVIARMGTEARDIVLANVHCDPDLFRELYVTTSKAKVSINAAKAIADPVLDDERLAHVLAVDNRPGVLGAVFANIVPTVEEITEGPLRGALGQQTVAKAVADHWMPAMDLELLAAMPAEDLHAYLRVWRLLAPSLTDAEVLSELVSFSTWGSYKQQVVMGWILHRRPHLITGLVDTDDRCIMTQAAGSHTLGRLSVEEQARLLDLDKLGTTHPRSWYDDRQYAWMAAASNLTVSVTLLDQIQKGLNECSDLYNSQGCADRRQTFNPWSIATLTGPMEPATSTALVRWVSPGTQAKGRPSSFIELLDNPHLSEADAEMLTRNLERMERVHKVTWLMPEVREAFVRAEARFPHLGGRLVDHWDEMFAYSGPSVLRWKDGRRLTGDRTYEPVTPIEPTAATRLNQLQYGGYGDGYIAWLEQQFGEDEAVWQAATTLAATMANETLVDFAATTKAIVA